MNYLKYKYLLFLVLFLTVHSDVYAKTVEKYELVSSDRIIESSGKFTSTYAPFFIKKDNVYTMFFCKNTPEIQNGVTVYRDRIWQVSSMQLDFKDKFNQKIVIQGDNINAEDDLSCAGGGIKVVDESKYILIYIVANRLTPLNIFVHYAESTDLINWEKKGRLSLDGYLSPFKETPSLIYKNSKYYLYLLNNGLVSFESTDGKFFNNKIYHNTPRYDATHGTVFNYDGHEYYVYSTDRDTFRNDPPKDIYISKSYNNGDSFSFPSKLLSTDSNGSLATQYIWTPWAIIEGDTLYLYYAGTSFFEVGQWWGQDSSIMLSKFNVVKTEDGDYNFDNVANKVDTRLLAKSAFGSDIYHYSVTKSNFDLSGNNLISVVDVILHLNKD